AVIDFEFDGVAGFETSLLDLAEMHEKAAELLLRVGHAKQRALRPLDDAGIADLTAALAIKRRLIENECAFLPGLQLCRFLAARGERRDDAFGRFRVVTEEFGGADLVLDLKPEPVGRGFARAFPGSPGGFLLFFHRG